MAIANVQSTELISNGVTSTTLAYGSNVTAGNALVAVAHSFNSACNLTVDNDTNVYQEGVNQTSGLSSLRTDVAFNANGGATTVTIDPTGTADIYFVISEWSGVDEGAGIDVGATGGATGTSTTPSAGTTGTLSMADSCVVAAVTHAGTDTTITEDTTDSFTALQENEGGSTNCPGAVEYKVVSATTAVDAGFTLGASNAWICQRLVLRGPNSFPYVVKSANSALSTASPSLTFTGLVPLTNDVVLLVPSSATVLGIVADASMPSGWLNPLGDGVEVNSDAHGICCAWHKVTAAEETAVTTTYTATSMLDASETGNTVGCVIRRVDPNAVVNVFETAFDSANSVTPHVLAGLTSAGSSQPTVTGAIVISCVAKDGTGTYTTPSGWSLLTSSNTNQGKALYAKNALTVASADIAATNVTPSAGDEYASITLAFTQASAGITVNATAAEATATAEAASVALVVNAQTAEATASAIDATVDIGSFVTVNAETAEATATAEAPTVNVAPNAGAAEATGTAEPATVNVAPNVLTAEATGAAQPATVNVAPNAATAEATATAYPPTVSLTVNAQTAEATATAFDATVNVGSFLTVNAETAEATATAESATVAIAPTAELAAATATAELAAVSLVVNAAAAEATATAESPSMSIGAGAETATATAEAFSAVIGLAVYVATAEALAEAFNATIVLPGAVVFTGRLRTRKLTPRRR